MPIESSEILYKYSVKTGAAGNSQSGTAAGSLGKYISTSQITTGQLNNLFDDITGDENAASDDEYRCIFVHNSDPALTLQSAKLWISSEVGGGADCSIAVSGTAASAIGASAAQAEEIADEDTVPTGPSFTAPTTKATGISVGDVAAGYCRGIWIKRLATNSAALNNDGVTVRVEGDTAQ